jgi:hypothetical protein
LDAAAVRFVIVFSDCAQLPASSEAGDAVLIAQMPPIATVTPRAANEVKVSYVGHPEGRLPSGIEGLSVSGADGTVFQALRPVREKECGGTLVMGILCGALEYRKSIPVADIQVSR